MLIGRRVKIKAGIQLQTNGGSFGFHVSHHPLPPVPHDIVDHMTTFPGPTLANGCVTLKTPHPSVWRWQSETVNTFIGGFTTAQIAEDINCDLVDGRRGL